MTAKVDLYTAGHPPTVGLPRAPPRFRLFVRSGDLLARNTKSKTMDALLVFISIFIGSSLLLTKAIDLWLRGDDRINLKNALTELWVNYEDAGSASVFLAPLRALMRLYDALLGRSLLSGRAVIRSFVLGNVLLLVSLASIGAIRGHPMGLTTAPWKNFDVQLSMFPKLAAQSEAPQPERPGETAATRSEAREHQLAIAAAYRRLASYRTGGWAVVYTVCLAVFVILIIGFLNVAFVALTRHMSRELETSRSAVINMSVILMDILIGLVAYLFVAWCLAIASTPAIWPIVGSLHGIGPFWGVLVAAFLSLLGLFIGGASLQVVALAAVVPMLGAITATALSVLLYPVRRPLHRFTSGLLLRAAENKEPIGYVVAFLTVLAATAAAAEKTWGWMFGG
jgi:hypothetical protein